MKGGPTSKRILDSSATFSGMWEIFLEARGSEEYFPTDGKLFPIITDYTSFATIAATDAATVQKHLQQ